MDGSGLNVDGWVERSRSSAASAYGAAAGCYGPEFNYAFVGYGRNHHVNNSETKSLGFLQFDISSVPADVVVTSVILKIAQAGVGDSGLDAMFAPCDPRPDPPQPHYCDGGRTSWRISQVGTLIESSSSQYPDAQPSGAWTALHSEIDAGATLGHLDLVSPEPFSQCVCDTLPRMRLSSTLNALGVTMLQTALDTGRSHVTVGVDYDWPDDITDPNLSIMIPHEQTFAPAPPQMLITYAPSGG